MRAVLAEREAKVEGQLAHEVLGLLVGVGERPLDREVAELAVVRRDVGAAAVLEVAADRVVVVAVDRRDGPFGDQRADLIGVRPVADEVAAAVDALDSELVDPCQRRSRAGRLPWMSVMIATASREGITAHRHDLLDRQTSVELIYVYRCLSISSCRPSRSAPPASVAASRSSIPTSSARRRCAMAEVAKALGDPIRLAPRGRASQTRRQGRASASWCRCSTSPSRRSLTTSRSSATPESLTLSAWGCGLITTSFPMPSRSYPNG